MNKFLVLLAMLASSAVASAQTKQRLTCIETSSNQSHVLVEYSKSGEVYSMNLTALGRDGSIISEETVEGEDPFVMLTKATTDSGDEMEIIQIVKTENENFNLRALICYRN